MTVAEVWALPAVVDLPTAGRALGLSRDLAYRLARHGAFPVPVIRAGAAIRVPTAELHLLLGITKLPPPPITPTTGRDGPAPTNGQGAPPPQQADLTSVAEPSVHGAPADTTPVEAAPAETATQRRRAEQSRSESANRPHPRARRPSMPRSDPDTTGPARRRGTVQRRCGCRDASGKPLGARCPKRADPTHGTWWARYAAPAGPDGKRRRPALGPFPTEDQTRRELDKHLESIDGSGLDPDRTLTVATYLDQWLERKRLEQTPNTWKTTEEIVRLYYKPGIGHLRLQRLRERHLDDLYTALAQINRPEPDGRRPSDLLQRLLDARTDSPAPGAPRGAKKSRKPLSPARIHRIHAVIRSALNDAIPTHLTRNPAEHATLPRWRARKPLLWTDARVQHWRHTGRKPAKVMVWTADHAATFLTHVADERLYPLFRLSALLGLRRGELLGLTWANVDLATGVITAIDALYDPDDYDDPDTTKTPASDRDIVLDTETVSTLRAWKTRQTTERLAAPHWTDTDLVFTRPDGRPLDGNYVYRQFARLTRRAGLPPIRFHDLRHTAATLARTAGNTSKIISQRLGHARPTFTDTIYGSLELTTQRTAIEATAATLTPARHG